LSHFLIIVQIHLYLHNPEIHSFVSFPAESIYPPDLILLDIAFQWIYRSPARRLLCTSDKALLPLKKVTNPTTPAAGNVWNKFQLL